MRRAILITGFNNWGKTTAIYDLFGKKRFSFRDIHSIPKISASFVVESHSNDDVGEEKFTDLIDKRLKEAPKSQPDLLCAFCPTREKFNNSKRILESKSFASFDEIRIVLLKNKWDLHAELRIDQIKSHLSSNLAVQFETIEGDEQIVDDTQRRNFRTNRISQYLKSIYP